MAQQEARDLGLGRSQEESCQEEITQSRKTLEEESDLISPYYAKNDRDVESRRWQSWTGFTLEHDVNSGNPSDCGANLVLNPADAVDCAA